MPFIFTLKIQAKAKEFVLMGFPEKLYEMHNKVMHCIFRVHAY